ncbi:MAG: hypothetical protein EBT34_15455, partial [Acetobacteraceae bacterium]|nr:hypothetical protein [Acetobacteraceae bacterium]
HGVCGACTVLIDGRAVRSCMQYAVECDGAQIRTVEGLADDGVLNVVQQAFHRHHALQCGFCTAGILMSVTQFLAEVPAPSEALAFAPMSRRADPRSASPPLPAIALRLASRCAAILPGECVDQAPLRRLPCDRLPRHRSRAGKGACS